MTNPASTDTTGVAAAGGRRHGRAAALLRGRLPALAHPGFRTYLTSAPLADGGVIMFQLSASWTVYELAKPPLNAAFMLGVLGFCRSIPMLALVLFGGVAADRLGRRRVLLLTNGFQAGLAALFALGVASGWINIWMVLATGLLMGVSLAFNRPSHSAFIRDLVNGPDVQNAVALSSLLRNVAGIGLPVVAGAVIAAVGGAPVLAIVAAAHIGACALLSTVRVNVAPAAASETRLGVFASLGEVFRFVRAEPLLLTLLLLAGIPGLLALPYATLLPVFADEVYGRGARGLGLMQSVSAIGSLTGAVTLTVLVGVRQRGRLLIGTVCAFGLALICFSVVDVWPVALMLLAVVGMSDSLYFLTVNALMLTHAPDHLRGRVMSLFTLADLGMLPLGSLLVGGIAGGFGARTAVACAGILTLAAVLTIAIRAPGLRRA
jgi:MFS family permease